MSQPKKSNQQSAGKKSNSEMVYKQVKTAYDKRGIYLKSYPLLEQEEGVEAVKYGLILDTAAHYNQMEVKRMRELEQKIDANQLLILKRLSAIKLNVDLNMESTNRLVKGVATRFKNRKEKTRKEIWREWGTSPTGISICCIGLIVLIFK